MVNFGSRRLRVTVKVISLILALSLIFCGVQIANVTVNEAQASELDDLKSQYNSLQKKLDSMKKDYSSNTKTISNSEAKITALNEQIDVIDEQVAVISERITILAQKIAELEVSIDELNEQITVLRFKIEDNEEAIRKKDEQAEKLFELFKARVRSMYMEGQKSDIQILLTSNSFSEYLTLSGYMSIIASHDNELIDNLTEELNELSVLESHLEIEKGQLDESQATLTKQREELQTQKDENEATMRQLEAKTVELEEQKQQAQALIQELTSKNAGYTESINYTQRELDKLEAEIQRQIKELAGNQTSDPGSYGSGGKIYPANKTASGFMWPLPGYYGKTYITSYYGQRWGRLHGAIDISGYMVYGKDVVASKNGTVITAYYNHFSFGNYIMIDHGNGYVTLYAHLSAINTKVGARVAQGEVIGKVGSTGDSTGPHLHFEIRINGTRVDPLPYIL